MRAIARETVLESSRKQERLQHGAKNGLRRMGSAGGRSTEERRLSAEELIQLEHAHGAHNYHPLPVVLDEKGHSGSGWGERVL